MAGQPKHISKNEQIDPKYLSLGNNFGSGGFASNTAISSLRQINQSMKTKNGVFNGTFGNIESSLTISSGILNTTYDSNGLIVPKRVIHINPETGTTDTLIGIDSEDKELPYQELILLGVSGDTITITHNSGSVTGTQQPILCPNSSDFTLSGDSSVYLVYDTSITSWIMISSADTSSGADNLGNHTATQNLNMAGYDITNFDDIIGNTGDKYVFDGSNTYMTGSTTTSGRVNIYNNGVNVTSFLTSGILTKDIDIDGNTLYLDSDGDSSIESFTDDTINFNTSSSNRMSISNSSINMNNPLNMFSNDISGIKVAEFNNTGIPSSSQTGIGSTTGDMYYNALTNDSHFFRINGTTEVEIDADGIDIRNGWLELEERTAPSGLSNHARIYAKDNGSGKTQLVVIFGSGAEQVIATEP